ncbi:MAG: hypothetical protein K8S23_09695 [Candidatus Cloacimonetes bacterium]|nr:hypothetical protein [Candidatus Cloacimonadota bacterium]
MHTITLKIQNSMYKHIIYLLKNLNTNEVEIISEKMQPSQNEILRIKLKQLLEKKIEPFKLIKDPMKWQKEQRDDWEK